MKDLKLIYPVKIKKEEDGFIALFRDFSNIFSEGDTYEECIKNSQEALEGMLICMLEDNETIKEPSKILKDEEEIVVSPKIAAPILLHILRCKQKKTLKQVAESMKISYQQYQKLEKKSNMTLGSLTKAVSALGGHVEISVRY